MRHELVEAIADRTFVLGGNRGSQPSTRVVCWVQHGFCNLKVAIPMVGLSMQSGSLLLGCRLVLDIAV
jgi:hypothetical protein